LSAGRKLLLSARQRRGIAAITLISLITLAAAQRILWPDRWPQSERLRYDEKSFIVVKVADSDTIDLDTPNLKTGKLHLQKQPRQEKQGLWLNAQPYQFPRMVPADATHLNDHPVNL
jgi:hypothetical protein